MNKIGCKFAARKCAPPLKRARLQAPPPDPEPVHLPEPVLPELEVSQDIEQDIEAQEDLQELQQSAPLSASESETELLPAPITTPTLEELSPEATVLPLETETDTVLE